MSKLRNLVFMFSGIIVSFALLGIGIFAATQANLGVNVSVSYVATVKNVKAKIYASTSTTFSDPLFNNTTTIPTDNTASYPITPTLDSFGRTHLYFKVDNPNDFKVAVIISIANGTGGKLISSTPHSYTIDANTNATPGDVKDLEFRIASGASQNFTVTVDVHEILSTITYSLPSGTTYTDEFHVAPTTDITSYVLNNYETDTTKPEYGSKNYVATFGGTTIPNSCSVSNGVTGNYESGVLTIAKSALNSSTPITAITITAS